MKTIRGMFNNNILFFQRCNIFMYFRSFSVGKKNVAPCLVEICCICIMGKDCNLKCCKITCAFNPASEIPTNGFNPPSK